MIGILNKETLRKGLKTKWEYLGGWGKKREVFHQGDAGVSKRLENTNFLKKKFTPSIGKGKK